MPFYPCACDAVECGGVTQGRRYCDFVRYGPQDIKKGETLATVNGLVPMICYKLCDTCKWLCKDPYRQTKKTPTSN